MTTPTTPPDAVQMPPLPKPFANLKGLFGDYMHKAWENQMHAYAQAHAAQCTAELEKRVAYLERYSKEADDENRSILRELRDCCQENNND